MTLRLAVLCPDPADPLYGERILPPISGYSAIFHELGVEVTPHPWVQPAPADVDGVLAGLAWGYHFQLDAWTAMLRDWNPTTPLINPPSVLLWNTRKTYLKALAAEGVRIIPTLTPLETSASVVEAAFEQFNSDTLVIKPLVSAGSHLTTRLRRGEAAPAPAADRMIQPYLPSVAEEGEWSLFYFGGRFSHAVRKVAAPDDFRVQPQFGARLSAFTPTDEAFDLAARTLAAAPDGLVYARIDMVRDLEGRLALMELEAIEPDLYFSLAPDRGRAFAEAVLVALKKQP